MAEPLAPDHDDVLRLGQERGRFAQVVRLELGDLREALERVLREERREVRLAFDPALVAGVVLRLEGLALVCGMLVRGRSR